jgi:hypothetical protein
MRGSGGWKRDHSRWRGTWQERPAASIRPTISASSCPARVLLRVASAPLARPVRAADANRHHRELCAELPPGATVSGELVVALQLHTDPLGDPVHEMCGVVTDELGELSRRAGTGRAFLLTKSHDFARCWAHWHPH